MSNYEVYFADENSPDWKEQDFERNPAILARSFMPYCTSETLTDIVTQLPWRSVGSQKLVLACHKIPEAEEPRDWKPHLAPKAAATTSEPAEAIWDQEFFHPRKRKPSEERSGYLELLHGNGAAGEFWSPWQTAPLGFANHEEAAAFIPKSLAKGLAAFKPGRRHPFMMVLLPWLDCIWSPALAEALEPYLAAKASKNRVFFFFGASPNFHAPLLEAVPSFSAERTSLSPETLYTEEEVRALRFLAKTETPNCGRLYFRLGLSPQAARALWREQIAKGFIREKEGRVEIDGPAILKSIEGLYPEIGTPDDLGLFLQKWAIHLEAVRCGLYG